MSDTPEKKILLRAIRDALQWLTHMLLIPVVALLKAGIAGLNYLHDELSKF